MKEIDFLPQWYKQGRLQHRRHCDFYLSLGLIVFMMIAWSLFSNSRVAAVRARNISLKNMRLIQAKSEAKYNSTQSEYNLLISKNSLLDSIKGQMVVSNVIAELTHLLEGQVVLKSVEFKAMPFAENNKNPGITIAGQSVSGKSFDQKVKFKIKLSGLASDAAKVAEMINSLENSDYFFNVIPGFSRNAAVGRYQVSEFEITCYLSNYKMQG